MQCGTIAHEYLLHSTLFKQVHPLMINTITLLIPAPHMPTLTGSHVAAERFTLLDLGNIASSTPTGACGS